MATFDNYLRCVDYQGHDAAPNYPGFTQFFKEDTGMWYFAMVSTSGKVLLKSEAYASEAGRNNGIESVNRNRDIAERFSVANVDGRWRAILKAGNRQEIAQSCGFDSETEAQSHVATCDSTYVEPAPIALAASALTAEKTASAPKQLDHYLDCEVYAANPDLAQAGFSGFFDDARQNYFFAMHDRAGRVLLRSEGYTSEAGRNNGVESVIKNREIRERYKVKGYPDGRWVGSLVAGNNQEIGRSCPFRSEAEATAWIDDCLGWNYVAPVVVERIVEAAPVVVEKVVEIAPIVVETPKIEIPVVVAAAAVPLVVERLVEFTKEEPKVEVKIEAPKVEIPIVAVAAPIIVEKVIEVVKEVPKVEIPVVPIIAAAPIIVKKVIETIVEKKVEPAKPAYVPQKSTPKVVETPKIVETPKVVETRKVETAYVPKQAPVVVPPVVEAEAAGGCMKYWWLLPLLLALGGLIWWLTKDGCSKKAELPIPKVEIPTAAAPIVPAPAVVAPVCNCTGNQDPLFNIPTGVTPKSLTRLGTCPEFGDSHGLSGAEFYAKIAKKAASNKVDKLFLDRVFKGMGYTGFVDAKPEMFTEVEVPAGTAGNMGYAVNHKTAYDRLDATGKDLLAFRIKSANGCDMHFMKTCGNHFFFCPR
jgi:uncharacterized protein YegP (UPF0339 family)